MPAKSIRSHIIPKHHLKQFANTQGCIFTYPDPDQHRDAQCIGKGGGSVVKNSAAIKGFYSSKIEQILDQRFESQGSRIVSKILKKQPITLDERRFFVKYVTSFILRVPATERTIRRLYPRILQEMASVEYFIERYGGRVDLNAYYKALTDPAQEDERIRLCWENAIEAEHKLVYNTLLSRGWWVAKAVPPEYFITSDNPLFYSTSRGMADPSVQITFPLSQGMAMVFDGYQETPGNPNIEYYPASYFLGEKVDLINKRTADNSTYLYSPNRDIYVESLVGYRVSSSGKLGTILKI